MIEVLERHSSNIGQCSYDSDTQDLTIAFKGGGTYRYANVPQSVWLGLQNAASVGAYFHRQIKGRYSDERVD